LNSELKEYGLRPSDADPCVYYKGKGKDLLLVLIYVDDMLILSRELEKIGSFKAYLAKIFDVKDLGNVKCCLGIEFLRSDGKVSLRQTGYIDDVLSRFNMSDCKPVASPMDIGLKLVKASPAEADNSVPYRELIGSLMYLAVGTRPDIAHAVSKLSQFNECHGKTHWIAAKRVLRYLKGTRDLGLVYTPDDTSLRGFVDADWGSCIDDRKSYTGYSFILGGASVSWDSKKQKTVALSSTEAEYMSLTEATKETIYLRNFLIELGFENFANVTLYCDNRSALDLAVNPVFHSRTKHIDIRHHFVRTALKDGTIRLKHVFTDDMIADILTKGLSGPKHKLLSERLGLRP